MLASRKSKSMCLVCNGTGLLTKTKKSKSSKTEKSNIEGVLNKDGD